MTEAALKGSVLRSYAQLLASRGLLDGLARQASPDLREALTILPTSGEWVPARLTNEISEISGGLFGDEKLRQFTKEANRTGIVRILEPVIRTALRLGGARPHAVLSRLGIILRAQQLGYTWGYDELAPNRARLTMTVEGLRETHATLVGWEGALEITFDLLGTTGRIRAERMTWDGQRSVCPFLATW